MLSRINAATWRIAGLTALILLFVAPLAQAREAEKTLDGGAINGRVEYGGASPSPAPLAITKDRDICGTSPAYDQSLIVGQDRGLANAVVTVSDGQKSRPLKPESRVPFDQKGCEYIPHVAVFPAGSTVVIFNSDGILHNIHTESTINPVIDLAQPGFKKQIVVRVEKPEVIKVTCDAHNWMEGWWYVTATPYYAITDNHGRYAVEGIPPGTYTLRVWQERLGTRAQRVVVQPNSVTMVNLTLTSLKNRGS